MSRIGKKPISIPPGTEVSVSGNTLTVKGAAGTVTREFSPEVQFAVAAAAVSLTSRGGGSGALWGTYASHVSNMVRGVNSPFEKKLIVEGVGFKADVKGDEIVMSLGFSHPVKVKIPKNLKVKAEKNIITVSGPDIEAVGQFAAQIRDWKKPEPYKGKGIRYENEVIRRKQGKKTA